MLTPALACWTIAQLSSQPIEYRWRGPVTDAEVVALVRAHGGQPAAGWWDQIRPCSLGWVTTRLQGGGGLVGFVNLAWDGGDHAFFLDTKVAGEHQRQGIATPWWAMLPGTPRRQVVSGSTSTSRSTWRRSTSMPVASGPLQPG
jgi:hypothetical protein